MGFIAEREVDEAAAALAGGAVPTVGAAAVGAGAVLAAGGAGGCCDCWEEALLLVVERAVAVPLVVGAVEDETEPCGGGLRLVVEELLVLVVELLLVLRVEPTSLRKREFMDVDDIYEGDIIASGGIGQAATVGSRGACRTSWELPWVGGGRPAIKQARTQ